MPRQGLNRETILYKAVEIINLRGYQQLTFAILATELGVKPPAMFKHYKNLDALRQNLTLHGLNMLKQHLQDAVTGRSGEEAFNALCHAYRDFAKANKGLYQAMQPSYFVNSKEVEQTAMQLMGIMIRVLKGFNIAANNYIHPLRILRSSLHGFVVLEIDFHFGMPGSIDTSFQQQIKTLLHMVKSFEE